MAGLINLLDEIPADQPEELVQTLPSTPSLLVEWIVSLGHTSRDGFWYDQGTHEWVLLLSGAARLRLDGGKTRSAAGLLRQHPRAQAASGRVDGADPADDLVDDPLREHDDIESPIDPDGLMDGDTTPNTASIMAEERKPRQGKGSGFVKIRLKRLRQEDDTWEADFQALPKPIEQTVTHYLSMVVSRSDGSLLAERPVQGRPSVNELATLLAHAMSRPLTGHTRRPRYIHLRGYHQWRELFPILKELGIEVSVERELPGINEAYEAHLRRLREAWRVGMVGPSPEQAKVEEEFPAIARWVREHGRIEIGQQEQFAFVASALHEGGIQVEDERPDTLVEAMAALEVGRVRWFDEQGIELESPPGDERP